MSRTIYREMGGRETVEAVVDDFYDRVLSDERLAPFFEDTSMEELRSHQVQFISSVAGGPVEYSGDEMRDAHAHLDIGGKDFEAVATHLERALRSNGVDDDSVEAIMREVAALKPPVVGQSR